MSEHEFEYTPKGTIEEFIAFTESMFRDIPKKTMTWGTGREGAINAEVELRYQFQSHKEKTKEEIRKEVESQVWEDGLYIIGGDPYIKYDGLSDSEHPDGYFLENIRGLYYVEHWKDGWRIQYKIVSEEEFNELKNNHRGA